MNAFLAQCKMKGATMIEMVITIVILSIAMLAVVSVYTNAISRSADPLIYARSVELGQAFLDEIVSKKYDHNTPAGGVPAAGSSGGPALSTSLGHDTAAGETASDRSNYNDVDDYNGKTYTSLEFITGQTFNQYVNYQVTINVAYINADPLDLELQGLGLANNSVKRIDVIVTNPLGRQLTFSAYKGNF